MDKHEIMTMKEVSDYLRVSERTVLDWAQKGEIPCGKIGSSWRFIRSEVEKWLNNRLSAAPLPHYSRIKLELILNRECVLICEDKISKQEALLKLVEVIAKYHEFSEPEKIREGILQREALLSTGIGLGIAVPHFRSNSIRNICMGAMLVRQGIDDYEALDNQPVKLIFMVIVNDGQHSDYLKFLATLTKQLQDVTFREELVQAKDVSSFYMKLICGS